MGLVGVQLAFEDGEAEERVTPLVVQRAEVGVAAQCLSLDRLVCTVVLRLREGMFVTIKETRNLPAGGEDTRK